MGNYTIFWMLGNPRRRQASKKFYKNCSENSRSQIVFRTEIFQKLSLGAPDYSTLHSHTNTNFARVCLLVKMASTTVTRSIMINILTTEFDLEIGNFIAVLYKKIQTEFKN